MKSCVILGAGGHGRVILEAVQQCGEVSVWGILDSDNRCMRMDVAGIQVKGGDDMLSQVFQHGVSHFILGMGSVGNTAVRRKCVQQAVASGLLAMAVVHPTSTLASDIYLGNGVQILAGTIVNSGAKISDYCILNTGSIIEHDCIIGEYSHIAPGAVLAGGVELGSDVHIGAGAVVLEGRKIAAGSMIGAGAVVVKDILIKSTVVGNPARRI